MSMRPTEITLHQKSRNLELTYEDGKQFSLPAEFLRVLSPSAEVRGHTPGSAHEKGELTISLTKDQVNQVILEVSDTGPGIPREVSNKIFAPLFTTKDPEKGTGLGLFVVKQIVDECKGKIQVLGQPGEGTTFRITFPPPQEPALDSIDME